MRVITFQDNRVLIKLVGTGEYSKKLGSCDRAKAMDIEMIPDGFRPLYAFASIGGIPVCLRAVSVFWSYLIGYMGLMDEGVMLELEVPENEILNMKLESDTETGIMSGYSETIRNYDILDGGHKTYEVVLRRFRLDWLVAYYFYKRTLSDRIKVTPVVFNRDMYPLWEKRVYFSGDGYVYDKSRGGKGTADVSNYLPDICCHDLGLFHLRNYVNISGAEKIMKQLGFSSKKELIRYAREHNYPTIKDSLSAV